MSKKRILLCSEATFINSGYANYGCQIMKRLYETGEFELVTIEVAVAGFSEGEIDISLDKRLLTVTGNKKRNDSVEHEYLHRGISSREFKQTFPLAEHVEVNGAAIKDGILTVYLERKVPESAKPKSIAITYTV